MPQGAWSPKRERQYEHIKESLEVRGANLRSHKGSGGRTYDQLRDEARERGIKGRSMMRKSQLEKILSR
jgi:hypothetical protein